MQDKDALDVAGDEGADEESSEFLAQCGNGIVEGGEECDDDNLAGGDGCESDCTWTCHNDAECGDGHDCADDVCDMVTHVCGHEASLSGTLCRPGAGPCDAAEYCTGLSVECPPDVLAAAGTPCDDADACTTGDVCDERGGCTGVPAQELQGVEAIAAGGNHTCIVSSGGGIKCWGFNNDGQIGDGTGDDRTRPVNVVGLSSGFVAAAGGGNHTCALMRLGGVKCWGCSSEGQIGDGTFRVRYAPVDVADMSSGVTVVTAGAAHTCAVTSTGGVKCWGRNEHGQIGDGTTMMRLVPVAVPDLPSGVSVVVAGFNFTCALLESGGVRCWGWNGHGQLGDGTTTMKTRPVDVVGLSSGVTAIATGGDNACALLTSGGVKCWGANIYGELGDGTRTESAVPVDVVGLAGRAEAIGAGDGHTCVILETGSIQCWGYNDNGQLGDGTTIYRTTPVTPVDLPPVAVSLEGGYKHTCAIFEGGSVRCWGGNDFGQLGNGTTADKMAPIDVAGMPAPALSIATGNGHTCALTAGEEVVCWGNNDFGQLGDGTNFGSRAALRATELTSGASVVAAGPYHTCAVLGTGEARCWGYNHNGQIGDGTMDDRSVPVMVAGLEAGVAGIGGGYYFSCALMASGGVKCWGNNDCGQLGNGTGVGGLVPVDVTGLQSGAVALSVGGFHSCALLDLGGVKCWGDNANGACGDGSTEDAMVPVDVVGLPDAAVSISAGWAFTCAVLASGQAMCWGTGWDGQLGNGLDEPSPTPVAVAGLSSRVLSIDAGHVHTCAVMESGGLKCWGSNAYGALGTGSHTTELAPVDVPALTSGVASVSAGYAHTCAVLDGGGVQCWGNNAYGQVSGFFTGYARPVLCP